MAVPTLVVAGPLLAPFIDKWVPINAARLVGSGAGGATDATAAAEARAAKGWKRPGFINALLSVTLPVILMLARTIGELTLPEGNGVRDFLVFIGTPAVALLAAVLFSMFVLGYGIGMNRGEVEKTVGSALPGVASILLIVAAGGGFKQTLVDAGVANVIGDLAQGRGSTR